MFGLQKPNASAYAKVGLETGVGSASPHRLIALLFDGALIAVTRARQHMEEGQIVEKGIAINKAVAIIDSGLRGGLNLQQGGGLASQLQALYDYMVARLTLAHLKNDPQLLIEVHGLLRELKSAWDEIDPHSTGGHE